MDNLDWDQEERYRRAFSDLYHVEPYDYQVALAARLVRGENVVLRAPTGSGKTKAVLTPFILSGLRWNGRPRRLIYALPLRSLVQQIHQEARELLKSQGFPAEEATIQTGEQPDDEFFTRGRIIVTTYDQVLSGLLCAPYGLSRKLRNVNAAAVAGALIVFDEFHLMGIQSALLTGAAALRLFRGVSQCVWMTATATAAPSVELHDALSCVPLALSEAETRRLPIVATTRRALRLEKAPLTAAAVKDGPRGRIVVIVNTVERAQTLYLELKDWAWENDIPLLCLHARFFKTDRDKRVAELRERFGRQGSGPAILIATQVVEAGIDISSTHLLTELCPMNALLQRAGRCARFENEHGLVQVFPLPESEHAYLPYGTLSAADPALEVTEQILSERHEWVMCPELVDQWVERVHGASDAAAIRLEGWTGRLNEIRSRVHTSLTQGGIDSVSELIRPNDDAQIRAIISTAAQRPSSPAERDSLGARRWAIEKLLTPNGPAVAWFWDLSLDKPKWVDLRTKDQLQRAFIVCLDPSVAAYSEDVGLRLGEAGTAVSPPRVPPKRPGYGSLHRETWIGHTRGVTREIERRLADEGTGSLLTNGFVSLALSEETLRDAVRACGLLHDLGKLQRGWQTWALNYQLARDLGDDRREPLAHTDFDPKNPRDRQLTREAGKRGPHAVASAWYGQAVLARLLDVPPSVLPRLASACAAAIVAHHGGWIPTTGPLDVDHLVDGWEGLVGTVAGAEPDPVRVAALARSRSPRDALAGLLDVTMSPNRLEESFPLIAYLTRALRLADQHATAEGGEE